MDSRGGAHMTTAVEKGYVFAKLEELEPASLVAADATDDGRRRFDVRRTFDITAFGINAYSAPTGIDIIRSHDEMLLGEAGQEELYIVLQGAATFEIDGESIEAPEGSLVHVRPSATRKATATEDDTKILAVGGTSGKAYEPYPEEASEAFAAYTAGDYETALAKQQTVLEARPQDPVAHFNAGCFAARAGHADEAIEHLGTAVEINERVKELMATDEDLDSIREDKRFTELAS